MPVPLPALSVHRRSWKPPPHGLAPSAYTFCPAVQRDRVDVGLPGRAMLPAPAAGTPSAIVWFSVSGTATGVGTFQIFSA